ncbi:MAG: LysR family transcriptional regulator [Gammaproteobacteria bacterium]|nr:LysR family transcriptional regulator [Gammaproteobacteria bacterium]NND40007.1 LysR family transcriptional regulator [Pseudomonadales bacterium]MBT8151353.1 LysR family transcriptional regulator [Gammaproteobacteria bacterium]NNL11218.1 LysR family transcriptional regulator [Pseudomonadales bacterium]NNM12253.1 LysR family transcriptional regulator [Pseudomonadales bacterium]
MKYTLRQLEVFLATAREGNVSKAAEQLSMSQSAASGALQDLEQRYSTRLFDRVGKRLRLNGQGKALQPLVASLLGQAAEVEQLLQQNEPSGELKVGATMTIGNYLAVPILTRFRRDFPDISIHLHIANTTSIAQQVLNFDLDIGLIEGEYAHEDLQVGAWRDDELTVFCSPSHPYVNKRTLKEKDLVSAQWILRERGSGTRQTFDRAMQGLQNRINIFLELEHTEAIKQAVAGAAGLGCLSKIALQDEIASGKFVALATPGLDMHRKFYFILHAQKYRGSSLERWLDYCQRD